MEEADRLAATLLACCELSAVGTEKLVSMLVLGTEHTLSNSRWVVLDANGDDWTGEAGEPQARCAVTLDGRDEYTSFFAAPRDCGRLVGRLAFPAEHPHEQHGVPFSFLFGAIPDALGSAVRECLETGPQPRAIIGDEPYQLWRAERVDVRPTPTLDGYEVRKARLSADDASVINTHWEHASSHSLGTILECVTHRPSVGVHRRAREASSGADGRWELVAWAVVRSDWSIGMVNVIESCRGRGVAKYLVSHLAVDVMAAKEAAARLHPTYTPAVTSYIHATNAASQGLFSSLGFADAGEQARWMRA